MPKGNSNNWPILKSYDQNHLGRIALPLGGIGTGSVSLGGRGDLRDWEIMNKPAKGFTPGLDNYKTPFFCLYAKPEKAESMTRIIEGPLEVGDYEGPRGSKTPNAGFPRFANCSFAAAYPLGQVFLSDPTLPLNVRIEAFNPIVPSDAEASGIPAAVLRFVITNRSSRPITAAVCASMPNFIGTDESRNRNRFRRSSRMRGIYMDSTDTNKKAEQWGTIALTTTAKTGITYRTNWINKRSGGSLLDFWDDFSADGKIEQHRAGGKKNPMASLAARFKLGPHATQKKIFLLTWHFPNRYTWTPKNKDGSKCNKDLIGNYYTTRYKNAWDVAEKLLPRLTKLESETVNFVRAFCRSTLPEEVKEAALFNLSTLRTQTCFRSPDGRFYGWEGVDDDCGCCYGSATHVWNYEQATAFLFGDLAKTMREVEFARATADNGMMSFRVNLPIERAQEFGKTAADGQLGCIMKMYRDWQLSGDDNLLISLWPKVKKALEFCWVKGGWDADKDGVMEGCQHNTMDVEYYGPNPQMGTWYLGALRAAEEMAMYLREHEFAKTCRGLFEQGKNWIDENLFNGEYYEQQICLPGRNSKILRSLLLEVETKNVTKSDYQLGTACLIDQLVGQYMAHVCGLGYLLKPANIRKTLRSIMKYNYKEDLSKHFNCFRTFAFGDESALLMASYPKHRPKQPFPYFTEVMTGFEYTAAAGMLFEGQIKNGLKCIENVRRRYDGAKRSPFDEAECGHHYARAMSSWAAVLALTGFHYSAVEKIMTFAPLGGTYFWSNGYAWGTCALDKTKKSFEIKLSVLHGELSLEQFELRDSGKKRFGKTVTIKAPEKIRFEISRHIY